MTRHFPYQHPTFGTNARPKRDTAWKSSVYYWWFEYLRRNADYKRTCRDGGKGKCAKLYDDFGDVFEVDFKTWWSSGKGVHLFAEPPKPSIRVIPKGEAVDSAGDGSLLIEVPLNLPITFLCHAFRKIVTKRHKGLRGVRANLATQARFVVSGKVDLYFLETALRVWDFRQENPNIPFWKVAQELRIAASKHWVRADEKFEHTVHKRNLLTATAYRYHKKAAAIIENVAKGKFPVSSAK